MQEQSVPQVEEQPALTPVEAEPTPSEQTRVASPAKLKTPPVSPARKSVASAEKVRSEQYEEDKENQENLSASNIVKAAVESKIRRNNRDVAEEVEGQEQSGTPTKRQSRRDSGTFMCSLRVSCSCALSLL